MSRPRKKLLIAFASFFALIALFLTFEHFRGVWMLKRWKARMAAQGEELNIDKLSPVPPRAAEENGLPALVWAAGQLGTFPGDLSPPYSKYVVPDKWVAVARLNEWYTRGTRGTNLVLTWARVAEPLAIAEPAMGAAIEALQREQFYLNIYYRGGFNLALNHLTRIRSLAQFLAIAALHDLHQQQYDAAFEKLQALLVLPNVDAEEPIIVSQYVRIAAMHIAFAATWQALQSDGWSDEQLAELQKAWMRFDFLRTMDKAFCMERAIVVAEYERCRDSDVPLSQVFDPSGAFAPGPTPSLRSWDWVRSMFDVRERLYTPVWKFAWSRQDELYYCEMVQSLLKAHRESIPRMSGASALAGMEHMETPPAFYDQVRFVLARMVLGALGTSMRRPWVAQTTAQIAITAIAVKRYALRHGKLPFALTELVPEFLSREPIDYMDGKPLRYCVDSGTSFLLYSVGPDGRDGGGSVTSSQGTQSYQNGRDLVWPRPASDEDVIAWKASRK